MKRSFVYLAVLLPVFGCSQGGLERAEHADSLATPVKIDSQIVEEIAQTGRSRVIVHMQQRADLKAADQSRPDWYQRGALVYQLLVDTAASAQADLLSHLRLRQQENGNVEEIRPYWICNCVAVTVDSGTLAEIAARTDVRSISANRAIPVSLPQPEGLSEGVPNAPGANLVRINAPDVWAQYGITGNGVTVGNMDTGAAWQHAALQSKYRGWNGGSVDHNYNWMDVTEPAAREPIDQNGHGTHTTGTLVGDDGLGNQIGVAPGAQWIAVRIIGPGSISFLESAHRGFQWMLAPTDLDGNNPSPDLRPVAVNNSWGCNTFVGVCAPFIYDEFRDDVDAWIAAGIVPEFSAGNEGPGPSTLRWPGEYAESFTTGATNLNDAIASFSSRGPSRDGVIKPNVVAPGVSVRSSVPPNNYGLMSGTSMAGPHVVGLVALLLEANPALDVNTIETIIQDTAVPLGTERPNNTFGWGRIDALAAVQAALGAHPQ